MPKAQRIESIDFWRGVALIVIFIDHFPGNVLAGATPRNFGFSDLAEAFIFLSGLALAYAYWPKFAAGETRKVTFRCLRRLVQIYAAHIAICAAVLAIFGAGYLLTGHVDLLDNDGRQQFFANPLTGTLGLLTLGYQLGYVNILPVYVVLLLMAPVMMALLRRRIWLGLSASLAVYAAAQAGLHLPSWPRPDTWFLDPFAWQLIFTLGLVAGMAARGGRLPRSNAALGIAAGVLLFALFVEKDGFGLAPGLSGQFEAASAADKQLLGFVRLGHFLSLAYVLAALDAASVFLRIPGAHEISRLGRNSLTIFSAGTILNAGGQLVLDLCSGVDNYLAFDTIGLLIVLLGVAFLILLAQFLEWQKSIPLGRIKAVPDAGMAAQSLSVRSQSF